MKSVDRLIHLLHLQRPYHAACRTYRRIAGKGVVAVQPPVAGLSTCDLRSIHEDATLKELSRFFFSGRTLYFPLHTEPLVSIVIVLYNRAELTLACLRTIQGMKASCEVIAIDNCSSDDTQRLFSRIEGVTYVRNTDNVHFLRGCNQGAQLASGKYILLLNSDTELLPGAIDAAVERMESNPSIGAVGGRLIHPDGRLQEAGSMIWEGGVCEGYGRGASPDLGEYLFARPVDFCSGAFLLTSRKAWEELGGFDMAFAPAYYEEVDYCARLWRSGRSVWYEPRATVHHSEFASSRKDNSPSRLMTDHQAKFASIHSAMLAGRPAQHSVPALFMRSPYGSVRNAVLLCDERIPHVRTGAGYPRANRLVHSLVELGYSVTLFPILCSDPDEDITSVYDDLPREVEIPAIGRHGTLSLGKFLEERRGYFSTIIVSRPTTMREIRAIMERSPELFDGVSLIYDAEAIFALREFRERQNEGKTVPEDEKARLVAKELAMCKGFGSILTVSEVEAAHFRKHGMEPYVVGHANASPVSNTSWDSRKDVLFVGAIQENRGPNFDAVMWFIKNVWPILSDKLPSDARFVVAGQNFSSVLVNGPLPERVIVTGEMPSLDPAFDAARIFVAPTLASAGIPLKVVEAAGRGVPVVCTALLAGQLQWDDGRELAVSDDPADFAAKCLALYSDRSKWETQRTAAMERAAREYSPEAFTQQVRAAMTRQPRV